MGLFNLPGENAPSFASTPAPRRVRRQPKPKSSGGFLSDLAGSVTGALSDAMPELGIGNAVEGATTGLFGGLWHLGTDWATKGLDHGDWSTYPNALKGIGQSFLDTGSTALKPFGVPGTEWGLSDLYEKGLKDVTGYKPRDLLERARDKNVGLLPAILGDVGNVALVGGALGQAAKLGTLGTLGNEARLADVAGEAGTSARLMKATQKVGKAADELRGSGAAEAFTPEQVAGRAKLIQRAETVTHPYEALAKRVIRPTAQAATERVLAGAAAEGAAVARGQEALTTAQRVVAQAQAGELGNISEADAIAHLRETQQAVTRDAIEASKAELGVLQNNSRPLGEDLKLYADTHTDLNLQPSTVDHVGDVPDGAMNEAVAAYDSPGYHAPATPEVQAQYLGGTAEHPIGLLEQIKRQYQYLTSPKEQGGLGINVEFQGPDHPGYAGYGEIAADLSQNGHLNVRSAALHGDIPNEFMATVDPTTGLSHEDMFRAVHDAFGGSKVNDFGQSGELSALREHAQWFTPDVQPAVVGEATGQAAAREATKLGGEPIPQKAGIMPQGVVDKLLTAPQITPGEIPDPAKPIVMGRRGLIEAVDPLASPHQTAVEAGRLAATPGWSTALVNKLPMSTVRVLDRVNGLIARHDINVIARERSRIVEVARRGAVLDPSMQVAIDNIASPLVGQEWVDGTIISRAKASQIAGAEIMAQLDIMDMLVQAGGEADQVVFNELNNIASQGNRIPPKMIEDLGLQPAIDAASEGARRISDERVATLIGSRLGTKGLTGIAEDDPTMTARQMKAWKGMQRLIRQKLRLKSRLAGEAARETNRINRVQSTIDTIIAKADADVIAADEAGQVATRLYEQHPFGDSEVLRDQSVAALSDATISDTMGGMIDTVSGDAVDVTYGVPVRPGTHTRVTGEAFAANGPDILKQVLDGDTIFRDPRVRLSTVRHTLLDDYTAADGTVIPKGTEVVDINPAIDSWAADPANPRSPWRKLSRTQAVIIGKALGQESIWDGSARDVIWTQVEPGVANLHSQFVDMALNPRSQFSVYTQQLQNMAYDHTQGIARDVDGYGPYMPPVFTPEVVDAQIQFDMVMAHATAVANGKVDELGNPTRAALEDYFSKKRIRFNKAKSPRLKLENGFSSRVQTTDLEAAVKAAVEALNVRDKTLPGHLAEIAPEADRLMRRDTQTHTAVERMGRGKEVVLGDGSRIDAADLTYQLVASSPAARDQILGRMQAYLALPPEKQTTEALMKIGGPDGADLIAGQTLDKVASSPEVLSQWQNLSDPKTSLGVVFDPTLAPAMGITGTDAAAYQAYVAQVTSLADSLGVHPQHVPVLLHAAAKESSIRAATGAAWAATDQSVEMLANGQHIGGIDDPMLARLNEENKAGYAQAAEEANALLDAGDVQAAQRHLAQWTTKEVRNLPDVVTPTIDSALMEAVYGKARGFINMNDQTQKTLIQIFATGDVGTLVHENMHALRQMMSPADVATLERSVGAPGAFSRSLRDPLQSIVRRQAEEIFVEETMAFLMSGKAKSPGMQPIMERLRDNLRDGYRAVSQRGNLNVEIPEDLHSVWDKYLDPTLPASPVETELNKLGAASARTAPEGVTPEQLAGRNSPLPGEGAADALRRQRRMDKQIERKHMLEHRSAERFRRVAKLQKAKADMEEILRTGATPLQGEIDKLDKRINRIGGKLAKELEDPKTGQVPPAWQPIKEAMDELWRRAKDDPTLAEHMIGLPQTFGEIIRLAAEKGFDPTHIRSFTDTQVERLVHETIKLGIPGRTAGEVVTAGTRKARVSGIPRTQSLEALIAATVEATHEAQTNELVSFIERGIAQPVIGGVIPKGWESWDAVKATFTNTTEELPSGANVQHSPGPKMMIPKAAGDTLRNMGKSYNHNAFRILGKPSSWWRTFILTLSPRWYVNNFVGNFSLATAEGVTWRDWVAAWKSYRQRGPEAGIMQRGERLAAPFSDVPGVTGASIYHELESPTLVPPSHGTGKYGTQGLKGIIKDTKGHPTTEKWVQVKNRLARANEVVDEIARTAAYHHARRIGGSHEFAIQRAYAALVDYGDLGPMERSMVRAVIQFYAWQKGILKRVASIGYHDPAAFALMQRLTDLNNEMLKDQYGGEVPEGYKGLINIPGLGTINTRGYNPFQDAGQLMKAQGIAESANPFIEALVRNELGAPTTTRPSDYRINPFGRLVPETNVGQDVAESFTSGLPQGQLLMSALGESPYPGAAPTDPTQQAGRFVGVNTLTQAQIAKIIERTRESKATLNGKKVAAAKPGSLSSAFQKFSGRDFQPFQPGQ